MDEREKKTAEGRTQQRRRRPASSAQRSGSTKGADARGYATRSASERGARPKRKSSRAKRRKRNLFIRVFLFVLLIIIAAGGFLIWTKYGPSKEKADLKQYYGINNDNELAVVVNNQVIGADSEDQETVAEGMIFEGVPYVEYSVVRNYINKRFYWDSNENILLYTLPGGSVSVNVGSKEYTDTKNKKSEDYIILKTEGKTAYIALAFIKKYTAMEYKVYENPNRAVVDSEWGEEKVSTLKRDTQVRYQGGVKSPVLTEVKKAQKVKILEDEEDWMKVRTSDGFIGYVKTNSLKTVTSEIASIAFEEPEYTNIVIDKTINMAWHNVEQEVANGYILETIANTKGLTTIAPTWFSIADTAGNLTSIASAEYVNYAHQSNIDVWATFRDFHGGISSYDETYEVLSYTSKRENLINQVIAAALQTGIDGINLDFELISTEAGPHFIQFVRELSVKCRQNGLVFSIDNYVPKPYNAHYDLEEQGIVADYVVLMGYDEHTNSSYEAGSVASYEYVKEGIEEALTMIPSNKLINAIPFYTRLWLETPKTSDELATEVGTEAANYPNKISSLALGMDEALQAVSAAGAEVQWDDKTKQNYAQWETSEGIQKIWLEDSQSIEEKLKLIKNNNLAGVAEWKLGFENSSIWDLILQYIN